MKHIIKNGLALVMLFAVAVNTNATNNKSAWGTSTSIIAKEGTTITVKSNNGTVLFQSELATSEDLAKNELINALEEGRYTLEIDNGLAIEIAPLVIAENEVTIYSNNSTSIYKPVVQLDGGHVLFSRLSLDKEPMVVRVYDQRNKLVFTERIENQIQAKRVYDFSKMDKNRYKMVVSSQGRSFNTTIALK